LENTKFIEEKTFPSSNPETTKSKIDNAGSPNRSGLKNNKMKILSPAKTLPIVNDDKRDGFFEEIINSKGDKKYIRLKGILKIGWLLGNKGLFEEGLDSLGKIVCRQVKGNIINPKCCTRSPLLLEVYQNNTGDEYTKYLLGEVRIFEVSNGRV